jgi:hypothetical protein
MVGLIDLPPERRSRLVQKYEKRIRELHGISAASIADDLGLKEYTVVMLQRKLGLRGCRPAGDRSS